MGNTQELRFQGLCLVNSEGYRYMCGTYDHLPALVRDRLKSSSYNLCAACVMQRAEDAMRGRGAPTVLHYLSVISAMEQQLKCEEVAA